MIVWIVRGVILLLLLGLGWLAGRGGFGWGGGRGNGSGTGSGGVVGRAPVSPGGEQNWSLVVVSDGYRFNGQTASLEEVRKRVEADKERIVKSKERIHLVVQPDARVVERDQARDMLKSLGVPWAEEVENK